MSSPSFRCCLLLCCSLFFSVSLSVMGCSLSLYIYLSFLLFSFCSARSLDAALSIYVPFSFPLCFALRCPALFFPRSAEKKRKARRARRCAHRAETAINVLRTNLQLWRKILTDDRGSGDDAKFPLVTDVVFENEVRLLARLCIYISQLLLSNSCSRIVFCNTFRRLSKSCRRRFCLRSSRSATTSRRTTRKTRRIASFGTNT